MKRLARPEPPKGLTVDGLRLYLETKWAFEDWWRARYERAAIQWAFFTIAYLFIGLGLGFWLGRIVP